VAARAPRRVRGSRVPPWKAQKRGNLSRHASSCAGKQKVRQTQKPPNYKVLLHNDAVNKREYVVQVLLKARAPPPDATGGGATRPPRSRRPRPRLQVVDGMTLERAYDIMSEAHQYGLALVVITVQEEAESICDSLRNNGLVATVEPDSGGRKGGADGGGGGGGD
jgi:ATP-dependent Clp protease adaptor protein ClpS